MQDYLETILRLQESNPVARVTEIAEALQVSKPTVSSAVKNLADAGLVDYETYGYIQLTEEGRRAAEKVRNRHSVLRRFFQDVLGVGPETAAEDACRAEHSISPATVERLTRLIEFIEECPRTGDEWLEHFDCYCAGGETVLSESCASGCLQSCQEQIRARKAALDGARSEARRRKS
jgi:DtxR family Mn-dependent transcriptional regulator